MLATHWHQLTFLVLTIVPISILTPSLFRYFQLRQLPNFALAAPSLVLCGIGCAHTVLDLGEKWRGVTW